VNVQLSKEEYDTVIEALVLYSSTHHKEFLDNQVYTGVESKGCRDRWLNSHKLIEKLEMIEGLEA